MIITNLKTILLMNKFSPLLLFFVLFSACTSPTEKIQLNTEVLLNEAWEFSMDSLAPSWEKVKLPHTPKIEPLIVNNQWQGDAWYKKSFSVEALSNRHYFIDFEGVMHESKVWINGQLAKHHQGGYIPFSIDATSLLKPGENEIILWVNNEDNPQIPPGKALEALDFNFYGGIYRNVILRTTGPVFITNPITELDEKEAGMLFHFEEVSTENARGFASVQVHNNTSEEQSLQLEIKFSSTEENFSIQSPLQKLPPNEKFTFNETISIANPKLWDVVHPHLYEVEVCVKNLHHETLHQEKLKLGVRAFELKEDGFYLNNERIFLNGTNRHQEYPYLGYAISDEANYRDAYEIKQAGFDFVRLSHYPHSPSFMQACDELGLITANCISGWQFVGDDAFKENSFLEIRSMARRDRNYANVAFWEVSLNESEMDETYMREANRILKEELDYQNPLTIGWIDHESYDLFGPARQHGKAPDYWNKYEKDNKKIIVAEYGDWEYYAQNAGFNQTAFADLQAEERTSRQLRGDGQKRLLQQAFNYQEAFNSNLKGKHTIGHANWLMFDYNRGYADDLESSGISDIFRIPKFAYYFYQSQRDLSQFTETKPTLFIANYWNDPAEKTVRIYSNCDEIELFVNDKLIAKKKPLVNEFSDQLKHPPFVFEVPTFEEGNLKAVGYMNGEEVATHHVNTPKKASKLELSINPSGKPIATQTVDHVFVHAKVTDENGNVVYDAEQSVYFEVEGAEIIGNTSPKAEAGIATILLKTNPNNPKIELKASAEGLELGRLEYSLRLKK